MPSERRGRGIGRELAPGVQARDGYRSTELRRHVERQRVKAENDSSSETRSNADALVVLCHGTEHGGAGDRAEGDGGARQ